MRRRLKQLGERVGPLRENVNVLGWTRYFSEMFILLPAATHLPVSFALAVADAIGRADALLPGETARSTRREMHAATGFRGSELARGVRSKLSMTRRDLVWRQRMKCGREQMDAWTLIETNSGPVHQLIESRTPFIIAGGHFTQAAGDFRYKLQPPKASSVGGAIPAWRLSPFELRRRLDAQVDNGTIEGLFGEPLAGC